MFSTMKCLNDINNIKVYNLTPDNRTPVWISAKKKKKNGKKSSSDDLLQDFDMPDVSTCMRLSKDGQYLMVCGTYKPVVKCYDLNELTVKFERGLDEEVVKLEILSEDYSKVAFLQNNRYLELHSQAGKVFRERVPRFGRDLALHRPSADLHIAAASNEIYRLNLYQGRFLNSLDTESRGVNRILFNDYSGLLLCGTEEGQLQCWDPRYRRRAGTLDCAKHMIEAADNLESIPSRKDLRVNSLAQKGPFTLALGNGMGQVLLYDIRSTKPFLVRDHRSHVPVLSIHFHSSGNVFSMTQGAVKIWNKDTGAPYTNMDAEAAFNDMQVVPDTGLVFFAAETRLMKAYFIPSLGPAPSWCANLDAVIEEMEENEDSNVATQYDEYTFVTLEELTELGLRDLIGTSMLRATMHGYHIPNVTYNKAKKLANPIKPANVIKKKVQETVAEQNAFNLKPKKAARGVNQNLLADLADDKTDLAHDLATDDRLAKLFKDAKYAVNPALAGKMSRPGKKKGTAAFKKRQAEIEQEEKEFEDQKPNSVSESEDSEADSVVDFVIGDKYASDSDDEAVKRQRRKLYNKRRRGD